MTGCVRGAEGGGIGEQLVDEPVLSEAGLSDDRDDATLARERVVEGTHEQADLALPAHEWCAAAVARHRRLLAQQAPRHERCALAFGRDGWVRLIGEEAWREPVRGVADQHLARFGGLLEARGDVDRIAEHAELALLVADRARHREAGIDTDAKCEVAAGPVREPRRLA